MPGTPRFASPARSILHALISLAGWALFAWWWWLVLQDVGRGPVVFTGIFLAVSLVVVVGVTLLWTWHNKRIWEQRGPRTNVRGVHEDWARDRLGRTVTFEGSLRRIQTERAVQISFDEEHKVYRPIALMGIAAHEGDQAGRMTGAP